MKQLSPSQCDALKTLFNDKIATLHYHIGMSHLMSTFENLIFISPRCFLLFSIFEFRWFVNSVVQPGVHRFCFLNVTSILITRVNDSPQTRCFTTLIS